MTDKVTRAQILQALTFADQLLARGTFQVAGIDSGELAKQIECVNHTLTALIRETVDEKKQED